MKTAVTGCIAALLICLFAAMGITGEAAKAMPGEAGFEQHCSACHLNGGNIINPQKPLDNKSLYANHIRKAEDIIAVIRKGAPNMPAMGKNTLPDKEAMEIANYILNTFK